MEVRGLVSRFATRPSTRTWTCGNLGEPGEVLGVVGGSGTGKSVLMNTVIGLRRAQGGTVKIFGQDIRHSHSAHWSAINRRWGVLFQQGALWSNLTIKENVAAPLFEHTDMLEDEIDELADLKIALAGLPHGAGAKKPSELSGGMIKRAGLARGAGAGPGVVVPRRAHRRPGPDQRRRLRPVDPGTGGHPGPDGHDDYPRPRQPLRHDGPRGGARRPQGGGHRAGGRTGAVGAPLDPGVLRRPPRTSRLRDTGKGGSLMDRNANYALVGIVSSLLLVGLVFFSLWLAAFKVG